MSIGKIQKERRISERLAKNKYLINISKVKKDTTAYANLILKLHLTRFFSSDIPLLFFRKKPLKLIFSLLKKNLIRH